MIARSTFAFASCASILACAQIVGIGDFPGAPDAGTDAPLGDAPPPDVANDAPAIACSHVILTSSSAIDSITVSNGFIFTQSTAVGVGRCAIGSTCNDPASILSLTTSDTFGYATIGASIVYSTTTDPSGGDIVRALLDGTSPTTLVATTTAFPSYVAVGDAQHTYWVDDDQPAAVHCLGCAGADAVWIQNLDTPLALLADATSVYVVASDSAQTSGIFSCGATQACSSSPPLVIGGLSNSLLPTQLASDGLRIYVPRAQHSDVVSILNGTTTPVVTGVQATALAVDSASGDLFYGYGTNAGTVARVKSDGSAASTTLSSCGGPIVSLAFDDANVYALVLLGQTYEVFSIPR